jgi:hypothetical protein
VYWSLRPVHRFQRIVERFPCTGSTSFNVTYLFVHKLSSQTENELHSSSFLQIAVSCATTMHCATVKLFLLSIRNFGSVAMNMQGFEALGPRRVSFVCSSVVQSVPAALAHIILNQTCCRQWDTHIEFGTFFCVRRNGL